MASISVVRAPSSTLRRPPRSLFLRPDTASLRVAPFRRRLLPPHSIADLSRSSSGPVEKKPGGIEQDPIRLWNRYVDWLYHHKELNLSLDVSRIGFTDEFVKRMEPRFEKAIQVMQKLEKGAIANPDERRMVGHYWLRSPKLAPTKYLKSQIENTLKDISEFADHIIKGEIKPPSSTASRFTQILCIGIGGSALGPQFVAEALAPETPSLKIRFIDSTDPAGIDHQIAQIGGELASTLVIAISKTGAYPETRKGLLEVQGAFRKAGLEFAKQAVAITQENSLLDNFAKTKGWLKRFPMFDWVGGRHSVMSAAGLLPAALQDIKIKAMLEGAASMDEATRTTELRKNPAALLAMCWYWAFHAVGSKDMVVLPYEDSFLLFSQYLQQLVMESLGKEFDLNGNRISEDVSVPRNKGSTDHHAYIQQLREGAHNFFVTFIKVLGHGSPSQKEELEPGVTFGDYLFGILQGTRSALYANNRESITVTVKEVNPAAVGALIALYERAVGIYASLLNINAYPDPGIEAGKKAAGEVLALQKTVLKVLNDAKCKEPDEALSLMEIADRCHDTKQIEIICNIIEHLAADGRVNIKDGNFGSPQDIKVQGIQCEV